MLDFSRLKKATKLSWRQHAWHALLTVGAVGVLAAAAIRIPYYPRTEHRPKDLSGLSEAAVLVLGNSQLAGLSERSLTPPTKNFALGGTGIRSQEAILQEMAPRMPKLRVILLGIDNIPLRVADIEQRANDFRDLAALGLPWYSLPTRWRDRFRFAVRNSSPFRNIFYGDRPRFDQVDKWSMFTKTHAAVTSAKDDQRPPNIFQPKRGYIVAPTQGNAKMTSYMRNMRDDVIFKKGRQAFLRILDYCDQHRLQVILVRTPTTPAFSGSRSAAWDEEITSLLSDARARHPTLPLPVWDAERSLDIPLENFSDPNHLGTDGLKTFAEFLNTRLQQFPYQDDSRTLFAYKKENLLPTEDPREDPWRGIRDKDSRITRVPAPDLLPATSKAAYRITLHPREQLYCVTTTPVHNGESFSAEAWVWSDSKITESSLVISLARDGKGQYTAANTVLKTIPATPLKVSLSHVFPEEYEGCRLHFANKSASDITFILACPRVRLSYSALLPVATHDDPATDELHKPAPNPAE